MQIISLKHARTSVNIAIITFKEEEFTAILTRFPHELEAYRDTRYNLTLFIDSNGVSHVSAIVQSAQGDSAAQLTTSSMIADLKPRAIVAVGIAGTKPATEFTFGDVVFSDRMYDFNITAKRSDDSTQFGCSSRC